MKNFKLFIISTIVFVASLFLTSNVFAYQVGEGVGTYKGKSGSGYQLNTKAVYNPYKYKWSDGESRWYNKDKSTNKTSYNWYTTNSYYAVKNNVEQPMYCIDKHLHSGNPNAEMIVARVLNPKDPKDAVILKMISHPDYGYFDKVIAVRAFVSFTQDYKAVMNEAACANINSGIKWASRQENKEATAVIFGFKKASDVTESAMLAKSKVSKTGRTKGKKEKPNTTNTYRCRENLALSESKNSHIKKARELFHEALLYGAEVAKGNIPEPKSVKYTDGVLTTGKYETIEENGIKMTVREITSSITFNHFNDDETDPVTIQINPDTNGVAKAIKTEYQIAGTDTWTEFNAATDFKSLLTKDTVLVNIRVSVKAPADRSKLTLKYAVNVNYTDKKSIAGALVKNSKNPYPNTQRYYIWEQANKTVPKINPVEWKNVVCTDDVPNKNDVTAYKDYVNSCCRGKNDAEFSIIEECNAQLAKATTDEERENILKTNKFCILKAEYCDPCNTKIEVPKTCSEFAEGEFAVDKDKAATITGPTDIKVCVMDGEDDASNPYRLTKNVNVNGNNNYTFTTNKYCNVSCKEDYSFGLPAGRYVISGRYFELAMGVSATKTCYTDMIDYQAFDNDIKSLEQKLNGYIASGTATVLNTEFVKTYSDYRKAITDIEACSLGWDNSYSTNPEITFDYQEEYIEKLLGKDNGLKFVPAEDKKTTETKWFCNGTDVNRTYDQCIGAQATSDAKTTTITVKECSTTNATTYTCKDVQKQVPTTKYAKVATKFEATYTPQSVFYTKYSTGVIDINREKDKHYTKVDAYLDSKIDENIKVRGGSLPVSLKDGKGVYNYDFKFKNIGEFFDKDGYGRIAGSSDAVTLVNNGTAFKGTYVCAYVVNCPECKVACREDPTKGIFCSLDSDDDTPKCVGTCAFDANFGELYSIHQTSITNFNPTGRELGANLTNEKGQALIDSIINKGETIYNKPEYSFTFTPAVISYLRNQVNADSNNGYLGEPTGLDMDCMLYSDVLAARNIGDDAKKAQEIKGTDKDYTVCRSTVLSKVADMNGKVNELQQSRQQIESWLESDYCTGPNVACALVGNIGPAWK